MIALVTALHGALAAGFAVFAAGVAWRRRRARALASPPPLLLLRPTEARDGATRERLERAASTYGGDAVGVACTAPLGDAAVNRKVENLRAGLAAADPRPIVAWADEDVDLAPGDLDALVATLLDEAPNGVAIAPCTPRANAIAPCAPRSGATASWLGASILTRSPHAFELLARLASIAGARPRVSGKLVAIRAATLDAIGGFDALAPFIADDLALIDAVGGRVATSPRAVGSHAPGLGALARRLVRWLRVAGAHDPALLAAYPLVVAPLGVGLVLTAACVASGAGRLGVATLALHLVARTLLAAVLRARVQPGPPSLLLAPAGALAGDVLLTLALVLAWPPRRALFWGPFRYALTAGGRIAARRPHPGVTSSSHAAPAPPSPPW